LGGGASLNERGAVLAAAPLGTGASLRKKFRRSDRLALSPTRFDRERRAATSPFS